MYKCGVTVHIIEPGYFLTNICNIDNVKIATRKAIAEADKEVRAYYGETELEQGKTNNHNTLTRTRRNTNVVIGPTYL